MVHCVTQQQPAIQITNSTFEKQKTTIGYFEIRPNPISKKTTFEFSLKVSGHVKLGIYDSAGELISFLADENLNAGKHSLFFENTPLKSGIYFCTLFFNNEKIMTKKVFSK